MPSRREPIDLPEWHALRREASLVRQLIGAGATALGEASYASGMGHYYTAFFSLSVGIERLAKLVVVADHVLTHRGQLPKQLIFKKFSHDLTSLADEVHRISHSHKLTLRYPRPTDPISGAVLACLAAFADASRGRYANFETIGNPNFNAAEEPIAKWWREVVEPSLENHYRGKSTEARVKVRAQIMNALIGDISQVHYFDESGRTLSDIETASERTGQTEYAQKYGRYYTLTTVRWMMDVFTELTRTAGYQDGFETLFGHYEFFSGFRGDDRFLLTRKRWPLV